MPVRNAHGHPLCRHEYASSCTWWCTWHQFICLVGATLLVIGALVAVIGPDAIWQNMNSGAGSYLDGAGEGGQEDVTR